MPRTEHPDAVDVARPGRRTYRTHLTAEQRSAGARRAVLIRWSKTADRTAQLRPAREAYEQRFYAGADAAGVTDPAQREQMARAALRAEMIRLRQLRAPRQAELAAQLAAANAARVAAAAAQVIPKVTAALAALAALDGGCPPELAEAGRLRIDHPDESWAQLGARAGVSRDVITGRLHRLLALASRAGGVAA